MEEWRTIKGTNNKYSVSNLGNVKRNEHYTIVKPTENKPYTSKVFYKERMLRLYIDKNGYAVVGLTIDTSNNKTIKVHRLVALEFIPNPNNLPQINHKDENRANNRVDNLEWCNAQYNANYGTRTDKLRKSSGVRVAQYDLLGNLIKIWDSVSQASLSFGAKTTACIRRVCKLLPGRSTYRGYIWRYVDKKVIGDSLLKSLLLENKQMLIDLVLNSLTKDEMRLLIDKFNLKYKEN